MDEVHDIVQETKIKMIPKKKKCKNPFDFPLQDIWVLVNDHTIVVLQVIKTFCVVLCILSATS